MLLCTFVSQATSLKFLLIAHNKNYKSRTAKAYLLFVLLQKQARRVTDRHPTPPPPHIRHYIRQNKSVFRASQNLQSHYKAAETADLTASPNSVAACTGPGKGGGHRPPRDHPTALRPQARGLTSEGQPLTGTRDPSAPRPPCQPGSDRNRAGRGSERRGDAQRRNLMCLQ